ISTYDCTTGHVAVGALVLLIDSGLLTKIETFTSPPTFSGPLPSSMANSSAGESNGRVPRFPLFGGLDVVDPVDHPIEGLPVGGLGAQIRPGAADAVAEPMKPAALIAGHTRRPGAKSLRVRARPRLPLEEGTISKHIVRHVELSPFPQCLAVPVDG